MIQETSEYVELVNELNTKTSNFAPPKTASWKIVLALAIFPPVAFYLMWKDKNYHSWLVSLHWLFGFSLLAFVGFLQFVLMPKLGVLYRELGIPQANSTGTTIGIYLLILAVVQVIYGFVLKRVQKQKGELPRLHLAITMFVFLLDYILPSIFYMSVLSVDVLSKQIFGTM